MIGLGLEHLGRVGLWPTSAWRYEVGKRDLRLDLLRGFAVIAMIVDHIGGERSWLYALTGGDAFFVSAAEVFVFISGLLMGIIYAGVITRQGLGAALLKSLQRAWSLYLMTVILTMTLMALSAQWRLGWGSGATDTTWPELIISVLMLHRTFFLTDILLLYTLLVLTAVPVLVLLVHARTICVLAGSWGLWMLWQLAPQHTQFPWSIADNSVFNFPSWQALFVTALVIGYHRQRLECYWVGVSERLKLGISGVFVAAVIGVYFISPGAWSNTHGMLGDPLFAKGDLRIGRLLVFSGFFTFALVFVTLAWEPVRRALGWLLLPLGQDALGAYILHLFVVALLAKLKPLVLGTTPASPTDNTLFQIAGIAFIWTVIILRPVALTQLYAWFAKGAALLAAGRAYLYLPSPPR
ncbi:MAG TPA: OpgC domain-containing protein [Candidatus Tectomicrobia bacterium]|nr:OpgC domain-containing protein [Candidatus Tectomicrobia bacterium]